MLALLPNPTRIDVESDADDRRHTREDLAALRVVVRRGFTHDLADLLVGDLERQLPRLEKQQAPVHDRTAAASFHH